MAEIYFSNNCVKSGCWIIVGRKNWTNRSQYFANLRDYIYALAVKHIGDTRNQAVLDSEEADALGVDRQVAPAPLRDPPLRNGNSTWAELCHDQVERFNGGMNCMEVLRDKLGLSDKHTLETFAPSKMRTTAPEPTGWRDGERETNKRKSSSEFGCMQHELANIEKEQEDAFYQYVAQFSAMVQQLEKVRAPWELLVPADDPMHYDEPAIRSLENRILNDLVKHRASPHLLRTVHCLKPRLSDEFVMESNRKTRAIMLCSVVAGMRRNYEKSGKELRRDPDKKIMADLDKMAMLLGDASKDSSNGLSAAQGLTLVSKGKEMRGEKESLDNDESWGGHKGKVLEVDIQRERERERERERDD